MLPWSRLTSTGGFLAAIAAISCAGSERARPTTANAPIAEPSAPEAKAGYQRLQLVDLKRGEPGKGRPIWVDLWYPAPADAQETPQNFSLKRHDAARNAALNVSALRGWALLSHGAGGSADNYAWLATELARSGFTVAGLHHYGESRAYGEGSVDALAMFRSWERVADVVFAQQALLASETFGPHFKELPFFGIGHSSGGHTMLGAAGVPYDLSKMGEFCTNHRPEGPAARDCQYGDGMTVEQWQKVGRPPQGAPEKVEGFAGLVLFEPAIGPSFQQSDLAALNIPVHVVASRPGDFLSFEMHAKYIADALPQGTLLVLEGGEGHFIFLEECTYNISVLGLPLCKDAPGVDRAQVHIALALDTIAQFDQWTHR